jgi:hypothetical protein
MLLDILSRNARSMHHSIGQSFRIFIMVKQIEVLQEFENEEDQTNVY